MSSLVITVKNTRSLADLQQRFQNATKPKETANALGFFLEAAAGGAESASVNVQVDGADPVSASGTSTLTYASIAANDTVTIAGQVLTAVTGAPTTAQFQKLTDGPTTAANLAAAINAHTSLKTIVSATSSASVVTISALAQGVVGNYLTLATSNSAGFSVSGAYLTGGTGGVTGAATTYGLGL